jgi:hypothetical protein
MDRSSPADEAATISSVLASAECVFECNYLLGWFLGRIRDVMLTRQQLHRLCPGGFSGRHRKVGCGRSLDKRETTTEQPQEFDEQDTLLG